MQQIVPKPDLAGLLNELERDLLEGAVGGGVQPGRLAVLLEAEEFVGVEAGDLRRND